MIFKSLRLSSALDTAREFIDTTGGIIHVDDVLYPLFIQAFYPEHMAQTESFIELLYQVWQDPSPEHLVFLPDFMQEKFVSLADFMEVVALVYPNGHHEKTAFLETMQDQISSSLITSFSKEIKAKQRQKILQQGIRIAGLEESIDHNVSHMIMLTYRQTLPTYNGETHILIIEDDKNNIVHRPRQKVEEEYQGQLPAVLSIQSIKLLFNDPQLFHERYVLNLRSPYQPTHHISTKALKDFLLFDKPIGTKTAFDQHQINIIKQEFEKFKTTLPGNVIWNTEVLYDVPGTNQTLHGTIDLIWNGGLYLLTKRTPPSRSALLNGTEPELPLLAAAYNQPITHIGYIHLKGCGEDAITITRYNDASTLASENIQKLAYNYSRSQKESP
jgi:hypothetical protein